MRPSTVRNIQFGALILLAFLAYLYVSWNTAAAQIIVVPTPHCTPTGDNEVWCELPAPVTATATVTPASGSEGTPFVPTATPTIQPTPTATRPPRPTIELTPIRSGSNAHLPIAWK